MTPGERLSSYVREGLGAGIGAEELARSLGQAGWSQAEIGAALSGWLPVAGQPPVPRPQPYISAREALIYGLLFLLLGTICWHTGSLGFDIIDSLWPVPGDFYSPPRSAIRWSVAALIPAVPLFLWLNRNVARATRDDAGRRRSLVRKWFAAVTVLVAALALLGDLVAVIYALLNGDLTARFAAKAVLIAVIGGAAFAYYRDEIDAR